MIQRAFFVEYTTRKMGLPCLIKPLEWLHITVNGLFHFFIIGIV